MTFLSALLLGLLASAHCAGMCGGLQAAMQQPMVVRSKRETNYHLLALNSGRLVIYVVAGVLFSTIGTSILGLIDIPQISRVTRIAAATILILIGIQLLWSNTKPFSQLEKFGARLWGVVSKDLPSSDNNNLNKSFYRGLIWGFLPCGLVYAALVTTLLSDSTLQGGLTMLGFGMGTLPAMVLTGSVYQRLRSLVRNRSLQVIGSAIFIQGGLLILAAPYLTDMEFMRAYPQLMSTMFCVS